MNEELAQMMEKNLEEEKRLIEEVKEIIKGKNEEIKKLRYEIKLSESKMDTLKGVIKQKEDAMKLFLSDKKVPSSRAQNKKQEPKKEINEKSKIEEPPKKRIEKIKKEVVE
jgi:hypothetical protein